MSTEATRTRLFLTKLQAIRGGAVVTKYNDRSTSGIPDASLTWGGRTLWMEFKHRKVGDVRPFAELLKDHRHAKLQAFLIWRLYHASGGRAFFILFEPDDHVSLYRVDSPYQFEFTLWWAGSTDQIAQWLWRSYC